MCNVFCVFLNFSFVKEIHVVVEKMVIKQTFRPVANFGHQALVQTIGMETDFYFFYKLRILKEHKYSLTCKKTLVSFSVLAYLANIGIQK